LIIFVLLLSISYISAAVIFPATNVSIKIDGTDRTLQYAVDNGLLKGTHTYASASISNIIGQHDASQIWVKVNTGEKTLLSALSSGVNGLCGSGSYSTYSGAVPNPGHVATEIMFSSGTNLQTSINAGTFCGCTPGTTQSCGTSTACITYTDVTCTSSWTWPACSNPTYAAFGTSCGSNVGCDGAGNCVGYSGSGCGSCPFGTTNNNNCGNANTLCHACPNGQADCSNHWGGYYWRDIGWAMVCSYQTCGISGCSGTDVSWNIYPGGPNADPEVRIC
jgi:hypothetical protein